MEIATKKPALFENTSNNIWTDPHIQRQMLLQHLNPESDGATRKQASIKKIMDFIRAHSKPDARLLDLGCGPGLYTSLFHSIGYAVTGIDFNKVSIDYAREQNKEIHYMEGDYIKDYPDGVFDTIIMIYCDLGTHSDTDRDRLLRNIFNSLEEGQVFIFDVFSETLTNDKQEGKSWEYQPDGGFWDAGEYLLLSETFHYPENKAFAYQYNLLAAGQQRKFIVWDRYYSEREITDLLKQNGFREVTIHHDILEGNNFTSGSEMFVLART